MSLYNACSRRLTSKKRGTGGEKGTAAQRMRYITASPKNTSKVWHATFATQEGLVRLPGTFGGSQRRDPGSECAVDQWSIEGAE